MADVKLKVKTLRGVEEKNYLTLLSKTSVYIFASIKVFIITYLTYILKCNGETRFLETRRYNFLGDFFFVTY